MCQEEKVLRKKGRIKKTQNKKLKKPATLAAQMKKILVSNFYARKKNKKIKIIY